MITVYYYFVIYFERLTLAYNTWRILFQERNISYQNFWKSFKTEAVVVLEQLVVELFFQHSSLKLPVANSMCFPVIINTRNKSTFIRLNKLVQESRLRSIRKDDERWSHTEFRTVESVPHQVEKWVRSLFFLRYSSELHNNGPWKQEPSVINIFANKLVTIRSCIIDPQLLFARYRKNWFVTKSSALMDERNELHSQLKSWCGSVI